MTITDQVKQDVAVAMKARERERVAALRLILSELQKDQKEGTGDEVAVLRRERKELRAIVGVGVNTAGASSPRDMGAVMKVAMGEVAGRADGKRVSSQVREALGA
jgi:uncharacterized protein